MGNAGRPLKNMAKTIEIRDTQIKKLSKTGMSHIKIAKIYGLSRLRIWQICTGFKKKQQI